MLSVDCRQERMEIVPYKLYYLKSILKVESEIQLLAYLVQYDSI